MKCFYSYINNENFGIHKILEFWSGKWISKTYCFHAKHLPWIKKGPGKSFYIWECMVSLKVSVIRNMWVIHDIPILPFVYYISIWAFAVNFFLYCLMKAIKDSHSIFVLAFMPWKNVSFRIFFQCIIFYTSKVKVCIIGVSSPFCITLYILVMSYLTSPKSSSVDQKSVCWKPVVFLPFSLT